MSSFQAARELQARNQPAPPTDPISRGLQGLRGLVGRIPPQIGVPSNLGAGDPFGVETAPSIPLRDALLALIPATGDEALISIIPGLTGGRTALRGTLGAAPPRIRNTGETISRMFQDVFSKKGETFLPGSVEEARAVAKLLDDVRTGIRHPATGVMFTGDPLRERFPAQAESMLDAIQRALPKRDIDPLQLTLEDYGIALEEKLRALLGRTRLPPSRGK